MKQHILGDLLSTIFPIAVKKAETVVVQLLHTSPKISFAHEHKARSEVSITTYNSKKMLKKQVSIMSVSSQDTSYTSVPFKHYS